jgi:hypothetical protein
MVTDHQVRKLMDEMEKHGQIGLAAARAGMDRKTARRYLRLGKPPSSTKAPRSYRTRPDPFVEDWPAIEAIFVAAPELEAKTVFEYLLEQKPDRYEPGQLRTLQRRVHDWRVRCGPEKEIFFPQQHVPGEAFQTDFTNANELGITVAGEAYPHLLCVTVLPCSNWTWATPCHSESMSAIHEGVQNAVFRLGRVPRFHQTDNSTAATHDLRTGKRGFNERYLALMKHFDMEPRTTEVGAKEQNGDVEAANRALKSRLKQHLLLRGSTDFESVEAYVAWLHRVLEGANRLRAAKVAEEVAAMRPVAVRRLDAFRELRACVTPWSTIRVLHNTYSVPSRLIGEVVRVQVHEDRLEIFHGSERQLVAPRLQGRNGHRIDYRHVVWSLVRKPGAFQRYRYREELFPSVSFRRAYDALAAALRARDADIEYLRVLHLAASTMEHDVEVALTALLDVGVLPKADVVKARVAPPTVEKPEIAELTPDLASYDALLAGGGR